MSRTLFVSLLLALACTQAFADVNDVRTQSRNLSTALTPSRLPIEGVTTRDVLKQLGNQLLFQTHELLQSKGKLLGPSGCALLVGITGLVWAITDAVISTGSAEDLNSSDGNIAEQSTNNKTGAGSAIFGFILIFAGGVLSLLTMTVDSMDGSILSPLLVLLILLAGTALGQAGTNASLRHLINKKKRAADEEHVNTVNAIVDREEKTQEVEQRRKAMLEATEKVDVCPLKDSDKAATITFTKGFLGKVASSVDGSVRDLLAGTYDEGKKYESFLSIVDSILNLLALPISDGVVTAKPSEEEKKKLFLSGFNNLGDCAISGDLKDAATEFSGCVAAKCA